MHKLATTLMIASLSALEVGNTRVTYEILG